MSMMMPPPTPKPLPGGMPGMGGPSVSTFTPSPFMAQLGLPPAIMALFAPRPLPPYKKPVERRKMPPLSGVGAYCALFETEKPADLPPHRAPETKRQRKERVAAERKERNDAHIRTELAKWDPKADPKVKGEPLNTLFVGRMAYTVTEEKLRRELESFGPIRRLRIVKDSEDKPRGYAFVEFESDRDMISAYKYANGKRVEGRRILVDVEKGRTVRNWRPRRLGGGLGKTRAGGKDVNEPSAKTETDQPGRGRSGRYQTTSSRWEAGGRRERGRDERERERERDRDRFAARGGERRRDDRGRDGRRDEERRDDRRRDEANRRRRGDDDERRRRGGDRGDDRRLGDDRRRRRDDSDEGGDRRRRRVE
eukprot:TRINITY_DN13980_c0_g1_i1.p1 TRINITY_DN13980_c0_g1~~TRINITY_DN13980_c0_g1_i1.p1  ORF type:complete len:406 (+),score=146.31 TRINITY_DN13980_c0_g1_i1:122-1219(+)